MSNMLEDLVRHPHSRVWDINPVKTQNLTFKNYLRIQLIRSVLGYLLPNKYKVVAPFLPTKSTTLKDLKGYTSILCQLTSIPGGEFHMTS